MGYDLAIVQAVATLARQTGLDVIAEGVETEQQAQSLRDCGVTHAQGFLYARALPSDELVARFGGDV